MDTSYLGLLDPTRVPRDEGEEEEATKEKVGAEGRGRGKGGCRGTRRKRKRKRPSKRWVGRGKGDCASQKVSGDEKRVWVKEIVGGPRKRWLSQCEKAGGAWTQ